MLGSIVVAAAPAGTPIPLPPAISTPAPAILRRFTG